MSATQNTPNIIECQNLNKIFSDGKLYVEVLKGIDLKIVRGEMVAILGPSGSGKSTLLHLLGGLDEPTSGIVKVAGQDITQIATKEKDNMRNQLLGFVYQFHHLLPEFNALENVAMPLLIRGMKVTAAKEEAKKILDAVGLSKRFEHRIGELSGGERQRVAIARALVTKPACVLADEPTGNLDHKTAAQIYDLITQLNREFKVAFVIVTHDLAWTSRMQRVLTLENGMLKV